MNSDLILVRHARVADCYRGICYGRSDVPLGPEGIEKSDRLAELISGWPIKHLITSGAARTRALGESPVDWVPLIPQPGSWVRLTGGIGERAHVSEGSLIE